MAAEAEKVEPADSEQDEGEDVYEVERIIDVRVEEVKRANCYLAAWLAWQTWLAVLSRRIAHLQWCLSMGGSLYTCVSWISMHFIDCVSLKHTRLR